MLIPIADLRSTHDFGGPICAQALIETVSQSASSCWRNSHVAGDSLADRDRT